MDRQKAKDREKEHSELVNTIKKIMPEIIETDEKTKAKFYVSKAYDKEDIKNNVKPLFEKYKKYNYQQQFVLVEHISDIQECFNQVTIEPAKPIFVVLAKDQKDWILFCVLKIKQEKEKIFILFKDPFGEPINETLKNELFEIFPESELIEHSINDQKTGNETTYGPLTLRNLDILLKVFLDPKTDMLTKFRKLDFAKTRDLIKARFENVNFSAYELSDNKKFIKELKIFIDKLPLKMGEGVAVYNRVLEEEMLKGEENMDFARIEKVKKQHIKIEDIKKLKDDYKMEKEMKNGKIKEYTLEINKKFPSEMEKLSKIFIILSFAKVDKQLYEVLKQISGILNIDYKIIKAIYKSKFMIKEIPQKNTLTYKDINEIAKDLPKTKLIRADNCTPLEEVLKEIIIGKDQNDNYSTPESEEILRIIEKKYHTVYAKYENWKNHGLFDIQKWVKEVKGHLGTTDDDLCEAIAILERALNILTQFRLRATRILTILIFFHGGESKGRLCQIQTGEGKTIIVSFLAVIKVLQGYTVDVITSSPLLADDGVRETIDFYSVFGLTVSTNNPPTADAPADVNRYTADILYGTISNFQFDYLKDSFEGYNIRKKRTFGQVILDEVDSMLVDNGGHIAKLSAPFPGMECLRYIYIKIWQELHKAEKSFAEEGQKEMKKILKNYKGEEASKQCLKFMEDYKDNERTILKKKIKAADPTNIPLVPAHLKNYVKNKLDTWLKNALHAKYNCHEHEQYRIITNAMGEKIVVPVDYMNTGVTMKNTIWSNGLHQFVQLKHNIYLTFESLTSSFISNIGYIKNYSGKNIFGLTGTLGSRAEQELLESIYSVDFAKIPTYKEKKFVEVPGIIAADDAWSTQLTLEILSFADQGRAVLLILETEKDVFTIKSNLELLQNKDFHIRIFANEENAAETSQKVKIGDIIIATNIAGRGTNFKTEKTLEKKGGLHVCVGFLPCNLRVEDQAFGRTSRQGNTGTAQLIIRQSEVEKLDLELAHPDFKQIKTKRDDQERKRLITINNELVKELDFKDQLFKLFSSLYIGRKKKYKNSPTFHYSLLDLKEYWAFWLDKKDFKISNIKNTSSANAFDEFKHDNVTQDILNDVIRHNPFYAIMKGQYYLEDEARKDALSALKHALEMNNYENTDLLPGAHLKLFELAIFSGNQVRERFKKAVADILWLDFERDDEYKRKAKDHLIAAKKAVEKELDFITSCVGDDEKKGDENFLEILIPSEKENIFLKHIFSRQICLGAHLENINTLIAEVSRFDGVDLNGKTPTTLKFFLGLTENTEVKKNLTQCEMTELHSIGVDTIYAVKEIKDIPNYVITAAQIQIGAGIAALVAGLAFLPIFPIMKGIATTLISEGVIDIVLALLSQADENFNQSDFIKGKFISYGLSILTFGIGAVAQCAKILSKAVNYCRKLAKALRSCPYLKSVCIKVAKVVDKIGVKFEKMLTVAKFNKLTSVEKIREMEKIKKAGKIEMFEQLGGAKALTELKNVQRMSRGELTLKLLGEFAVETGTKITVSLVNELVMKPISDEITKSIKDEIINCFKKHLKSSITNNLEVIEKLRTTSDDKINDTVDDFLQANIFLDLVCVVGKEIASVYNRPNIGIAFSVATVVNKMTQVVHLATSCTSYLEDHLCGGSSENNVHELVENLSQSVAEKMFALCSQAVAESTKYIKKGIKLAQNKIKEKLSKQSGKTPPKKKQTPIKKTKDEKIKDMVIGITKKALPMLMEKAERDCGKEIKKRFKTGLEKSIRNDSKVMKKLETASKKDIENCAMEFIKGNFGLAVVKGIATGISKTYKNNLTDFLVTTSSVIKTSVDFSSYFTKVLSFIQENLKCGDYQNNVDEAIEVITTRISDGMCDLLFGKGRHAVNLIKPSMRNVRTMLPKINVPKILNKETLVDVSKSTIKKEIYRPFIDDLIKKIVKEFKTDLEDGILRNAKVMKIETTPVNIIDFFLKKFIGDNEIKKFVKSLGTKLFEDFRHDVGKTLNVSYNIIKNFADYNRFRHNFISFLEASLVGGDSSNDSEKIIEEISTIVAEQLFAYLSATLKGTADIIEVKKIKFKYFRFHVDKENLQNFNGDMSSTLKEEFIRQTIKLLSKLKGKNQIKEFLDTGFMLNVKRVFEDVIPFFLEEEIQKFDHKNNFNQIDSDVKVMAPVLHRELNKIFLSSVSEICSEENFVRIFGADTTSIVKKLKPVLDAIAPDLKVLLKKQISNSIDALINNHDLEETLTRLKISPSRAKTYLQKLSPYLKKEISMQVVQTVTSNEDLHVTLAPCFASSLNDIKQVAQIVAPLYDKELCLQLSQLISNENLIRTLGYLSTADKMKPVIEAVVQNISEQITNKPSNIATKSNLNVLLAKHSNMCRRRNAMEVVTSLITEHISEFISQIDLKELGFDSAFGKKAKVHLVLSKEVSKYILRITSECVGSKLPSSLNELRPLMEIVAPVITNKLTSQILTLLLQLTTDESIEETLSTEIGTTILEVNRLLKVFVSILNKKITKEMTMSSFRLANIADLRNIHTEFHIKEVLEEVAPLLEKECDKILQSLTLLAEDQQVERILKTKLGITVDSVTITMVIGHLRTELKQQLPILLSQLIANENLQSVLTTYLTSSSDALEPMMNDLISIVIKEISRKLPQVLSDKNFKKLLCNQFGTTYSAAETTLNLLQVKIKNELSNWTTNLPSDLKRVFSAHLRGFNEIESVMSLLNEETFKRCDKVISSVNVKSVFKSHLKNYNISNMTCLLKDLKEALWKQMTWSVTKLLSNEDLIEILGPQFGSITPVRDIVSQAITLKGSMSLLRAFSNREFYKKLPIIDKKVDIIKKIGEIINAEFLKQTPKSISQLISKQRSNLDNVVIETISPFLKEEISAQVQTVIDKFIDHDENMIKWVCPDLGTSLEDAILIIDELVPNIIEEVTSVFLRSLCQEITGEDLKKIVPLQFEIDAVSLVEKFVPVLTKNLVLSENLIQLLETLPKQKHLLNNNLLDVLSSAFTEELEIHLKKSEELHQIFTFHFDATVDKVVPKAKDIVPVLERIVTQVVASNELNTKISLTETVVAALKNEISELFSKDIKKSPLAVPIEEVQSLLNDKIASLISTELSSKQHILKVLNVQYLVDFGLLHIPEKLATKLMQSAEAFNEVKEAYDIMGLPMNASLMKIKRQFRTIALQIHPKRNPDDQEAKDYYKVVAEAYRELVKNFGN